MNHMTHIVLLEDLYHDPLEGDEPEELDVYPIPVQDIPNLIERQDCTEARSLFALYYILDKINNSK